MPLESKIVFAEFILSRHNIMHRIRGTLAIRSNKRISSD